MNIGLPPLRRNGLIVGVVAASLLGTAVARADCNADLGALAEKRAAINALLEKNKKAHGGKIDPVQACPQLKSLASAQAAVVSYMQKNKDWCSLPDELVSQSAKAQTQIAGFAVKACGMIAQMKKMQEQAAQQQAAQVPQLKLPAGPLLIHRPAASDGAEALPDAASGALARWPAPIRPYAQLARIDRPIGWQLLLAPCWWATALVGMAVQRGPNLVHLALFTIGAIAMRGAGSTFNDVVDRDLDRSVARTRGRPLASRRVGTRQAALFLVGLSLVGLAVLLCFNGFTIALGIAALAPVAVYPFMKRITHWPQAVLGLAFAWGALVGWSATTGRLAWPPVALYAGAILWTMGYDTIYALQDVVDDAVVGIGSTALRFGARVREGVAALYLLALAACAAAIAGAGGGAFAWMGLAVFAFHLGWQVTRIDPADPVRARTLFQSNLYSGLLLFAGLALQAWSMAGR